MYILIDSNNLAWIAHHSTGELSLEEKRVGVIYGFLRFLFQYAKLFESNKFIFCFDSKASKRKKIYPQYKYKRSKDLTKEQIRDKLFCYKQITELRLNILPQLGFKNIYIKSGYEADDLIACFAPCVKNIIVSSDEDLYQLLYATEFIYKPKSKKKYDYVKFIEQYSIEPDKWAQVKAIAGCSSDNVEGIQGVGEKKAIKYLNKELVKGKIYDRIIDGEDTINRNMRLVFLPFKELSPHILKPIRYDRLTAKKFMNVFDSLRFNSFIKKDIFNKWVERFNLK